MKTNIIESEKVFSALKSSISKLKKENSEKETPQNIELITEFDFDVKKYSDENFPAKFSIIEEESKGSEKIIVHTVLGGVLYNKTILKKMVETQPTIQAPPQDTKQDSAFNSQAFDQLNQMLNMRDEMMNRLLMQGDRLAQQRAEITEKGFQIQLEAMKSLSDQKIDTILELAKQRTELEVEKAKVSYQQGSQFWQELLKEGITVFKENPKIIIDAVDFIRELKAKPVGE
jgi:hypothetical protein